MKHYLRFMLVLLLSTVWCVGGYSQEKPEVTLDFTSSSNPWKFPEGYIKDGKAYTYTYNGYTITIQGGTSGAAMWTNVSKINYFLQLNSKGATLSLPAFDFAVSKIVLEMYSPAKGLKQNIYVDNVAVSTEVSGNKSYSFEINSNKQAANTIYQIKNSGAASRIKKIHIYKAASSKKPTTTTFDKQNVTLTTLDYASFTGQKAKLKAGETILTNELTYSKKDADGVITTLNNNDGTLVLSGNEGTATVTATFASNDEYASSTASYTITVVDPNKLEVTFDFANNKYGYGTSNNGNGVGDVPVNGTIVSDNGIVTITNLQNGTNNNTTFYDDNLRFYSESKTSVSVPEGYVLKKIISSANMIGNSFATWTSGKVGGSAKEWVATEDVNSVTFTAKATIKMANMTVYYAKATSGTISFIAQDTDGAYYATFSSDKDVVFTNDVVVSGVSITGGQLKVESLRSTKFYEVTDKKAGDGTGIVENGYYVPANTGVLVYSTEATAPYYFPKEAQTVTLPANQLKPAPADGGAFTAETGYKYYKLAYDNYTAKTGLGFYWGAENAGAFKVKPGTAYLAVPESDASNAKGFAFDGETTGIENVNVAANQSKTIYNLNGQRISNMSQAGLYIVNGKKVVIRK